MKRSAARLVSHALGVGIVTALLSALLLVASAHMAHAGGNVWTVNGPYGGNVTALVIDPTTTPSTLYAAAGGVGSANGDGGVFQSTNSGASWSPVNAGLPGGIVNALAIDPTTTPSTLYAGTQDYFGSNIVFQSTNSGASWSAVSSGLPSGTPAQVFALVIDPTTTPSTLYAGTFGDGVFQSTNSGGSWSPVNTGLGGPGAPYVNVLVIDPTTTPSTLYAGTGGGVFRRTNSGASWSPLNTGLTDYSTGNANSVGALVIDPTTTPSTLYAGTRWGVFTSTNGGGNWSRASSGLSGNASGVGANTLAIDPTTTPSTLFAGTDGGGVFKSTNSGVSWIPVDTGLPTDGTRTHYARVSALAIDPRKPSTLYAGTFGDYFGYVGGVFQSTNSGGSWSALGLSILSVTDLVIDPSTTPSTLYASTQAGTFQATNSGSSWSPVNPYPFLVLEVIDLVIDPSTTPSTLYAGTYGGAGVYKSTSSGASWSPVNTGLTDGSGNALSVSALAIDPRKPSTLYAGTQGSGVFKSTNSGVNWSPSGLSGLFFQALVIDPTTTPSTLYGVPDGGASVYKSTDSGVSWTNIGLGGLSVLALAIDPTTTPSTLYAGTDGDGVFKSTDGGTSGIPVDTGIPTDGTREYARVSALAIDPTTTPSTLYAGGSKICHSSGICISGGVFKSTNGGASWTALNTGLGGLSVLALAIDPTTTPSTLYAGTDGGGVFDIEQVSSGPTATPTSTPPSPPSTPTAPRAQCTGDCDGSGDVTVNEIITLVNMALGSQTQLSACPNGLPADITDVSQVNVTVIITAVNNALNGCGGT